MRASILAWIPGTKRIIALMPNDPCRCSRKCGNHTEKCCINVICWGFGPQKLQRSPANPPMLSLYASLEVSKICGSHSKNHLQAAQELLLTLGVLRKADHEYKSIPKPESSHAKAANHGVARAKPDGSPKENEKNIAKTGSAGLPARTYCSVRAGSDSI